MREAAKGEAGYWTTAAASCRSTVTSSTPSRPRKRKARVSAGSCSGCRRLQQADIGQLESEQRRRYKSRVAEPSGNRVRLRNSSAASAEASITLTAIAIGADQGGGLAWRMQLEPTHLGKNLGRGRQTILLDGGLDDGEQLALERAVMPPGALAQLPYQLVRGIFD
jgi:hypothetical protein